MDMIRVLVVLLVVILILGAIGWAIRMSPIEEPWKSAGLLVLLLIFVLILLLVVLPMAGVAI